ncbi:hypothetical protein V8B55DRAFT_1543830 [Mucor lusitanicus]|uniref:Uncharacterized protein n=2 Tax=Mucor circinelloides f. lusitanicus TaxID=29924 RepID=A0A168NL70_MUCCL|nr:hypothetical protein FB192DRAFT_1389758 [Mucor lusitanicus]OAD06425.1 hypothetical protein MUCCIDRAFT_188564 [Mucor lusitanicus CBS 277.49]
MNNNASPSIEVFLQPPSPTLNSCKLPSVKSLFPVNDEHEQQQQHLPSIRLTEDRHHHRNDKIKLNIIEPTIDSSSLSTSPMSPYQSSPIMTFSSPSSTTSSFCGSPLISPTQDGPFLLPPPDANSRRCRSVSNASQTSSPSASPYSAPFTFRSLSEPPTLNLPPSSSNDDDEDDQDKLKQEAYHHPIFGPKRKRGRPPNATRPETKNGSNWTFIKPTVWDVKQQQQQQQQQQRSPSPNSFHQNTPQFLTETTAVMADGINTFTSTNMDMALSIPKKKRGRKPKKQMAGNSCFVWRDLTAPRGANKKSLLSKNNTTGASRTGNKEMEAMAANSRTLLPAKRSAS